MQIKSFKELPIGKYLEILSITRNESLEEIDKQIKVISILNDMTEEEVLDMSITGYQDLVKDSRFLASPIPDTPTIPDLVKIGDLELIPVKNISELTTSQYVDFQTFSSDPEANLVQILSVFLIPKGCRYCKGYKVQEIQDAIRENLSVADSVTMMAFFFAQWSQSIDNSLTFLTEMVKTLEDKEKMQRILKELRVLQNRLSKDGDGSPM